MAERLRRLAGWVGGKWPLTFNEDLFLLRIGGASIILLSITLLVVFLLMPLALKLWIILCLIAIYLLGAKRCR